MRLITRLATETQQLLKTIEQKSKYYQVRHRAKAILLSYQGYTISQIMLIFNVSRNTVYNWFNNWETNGLNGLYNLKGRGRKSILNHQQELEVKQWIKSNPKTLKIVQQQVENEWDIKISKDTIKRLAKKNDMGWYRLKRRVKGQVCPELYQEKKEN